MWVCDINFESQKRSHDIIYVSIIRIIIDTT